MPYTITLASRAVEKQLAAVASSDRERCIAHIRTLALTPRPRGAKALAKDVYQIRVGRHRIIYKVLEKEAGILIGKIAPRTERTYQDLARLF